MELSGRFYRAQAFAAEEHGAQKRKGTDIPYYAHLLAVAALVMENGGNEDECIAALLHDAIEDAGGKMMEQKISEQFGAVVAGFVRECSDSDVLPKPDWETRKKNYLQHLADASASALLVSACDKLHNLRSIVADRLRVGETVWKRFAAPQGKTDVLWYYRSLIEVYAARSDSRIGTLIKLLWTELERLEVNHNVGT